MIQKQQLFASAMFLLLGFVQISLSEQKISEKPKPFPKSIAFNLSSDEYQRLLGGPPESVGMHSGFVTLLPGKTVGTHNTKTYEEAIIVLQGEGRMTTKDGLVLPMQYGKILYCPPHTEHDVMNTGKVPLKYIYVASKTK